MLEFATKFLTKIVSILKCCYYRLLFGDQFKYGLGFSFRKRLNIRIKKPGQIILGKGVFFNNDCSLNCMNEITIGDHCIFGENVKLYDHNHEFKDKGRYVSKQGYNVGKIHIGSNCWFGSNVVILPNVSIGNNCVIGTGCIVFKNVPENSVVKNIQQHCVTERYK